MFPVTIKDVTARRGGEGRFSGPGRPLAGYSDLIYVACPGCGGRAEVTPRPGQPEFRYMTDFLNRPRRLVCPHCTTTRDWIPNKRDWGRLIADPHGPNDPFFGRPLWLQTPCCGHILWAYNDRHLDTLESYVSAGLRERTNSDPKRGMPCRLPAWIKKANHRSDLLCAIGLLRGQFNRLTGAGEERHRGRSARTDRTLRRPALRVIRLTVPAAARWGGAVDQGWRMTMAEDAVKSRGVGDERTEALIRVFLRDGRLVRLPAKFTRRKEVLRYLAMRDFRPRTWYSEREVNEVLKAWCDGAVATDYVSIRRYLIDYHILDREDAGRYWLLGAWRADQADIT
jgi:hypothetical protein